jgi:hypothetical protein
VKVKNGKSVLRLVNPTDHPVHLAPNKILAIVSDMTDNKDFTFDDMDDAPFQELGNSNIQKSQEKKKFYYNLDNSDLDQEQKKQLLDFLHSNEDIFSEG